MVGGWVVFTGAAVGRLAVLRFLRCVAVVQPDAKRVFLLFLRRESVVPDEAIRIRSHQLFKASFDTRLSIQLLPPVLKP